jgi:hypothetical protein
MYYTISPSFGLNRKTAAMWRRFFTSFENYLRLAALRFLATFLTVFLTAFFAVFFTTFRFFAAMVVVD